MYIVKNGWRFYICCIGILLIISVIICELSTIHINNTTNLERRQHNNIPVIVNDDHEKNKQIAKTPVTNTDDLKHKQEKSIPNWNGGWKGKVIVWQEIGIKDDNIIKNIIIDRELRFVAINSGWRLEVYRLNNVLSPSKKIFDSQENNFGVNGCAWVKGGLIFWGNNRFITEDELDKFGDGKAKIKAFEDARRIWIWQYEKPDFIQELFKDRLSSAAADSTGENVLLFGRGGAVKEILHEGMPKGGEVTIGKLELFNINNKKSKLLSLIEEWGKRSNDDQQYPLVLLWNYNNRIFFIDDCEQIIKVESPVSRKSEFAKVLMTMEIHGNPLILTDMDKKVLVYRKAPITALDDGDTICCTLSNSTSSFPEKIWMAYYNMDGLIKEVNLYNNQAMPSLAPSAYTPDGSGIMLRYYEASLTSGKQYALLVWNHKTYKSYKIGMSYHIDRIFPFVNNSYLPFVSLRKNAKGEKIQSPGIIEIRKDMNADVYVWKGLDQYLADSK